MTPDGISTEDWELVHAAAADIVNTTFMEDEVLRVSRTARLFEILEELEDRYGRLPSLLATRADFTDDPQEAMRLHEEALTLANDPLSRRLSLQSLVRLLIEERKDDAAIADRLRELEEATAPSGDGSDLEELRDLQSAFKQLVLERTRQC